MSVTEPNPPGLQNQQADVAHRLVGSTPAPLRSRITWKYGISGPGCCPFCRYLGTAPCEPRPRRRHWAGRPEERVFARAKTGGAAAGALLPAAAAMGIPRAEPHTPVDR